MSGDAIVRPEELRNFAQALTRCTQELDAAKGNLRSLFSRLGDTWRDREYVRFAGTFEETMRMIERFTVEANELAPFLLRKADAADQYLQQR